MNKSTRMWVCVLTLSATTATSGLVCAADALPAKPAASTRNPFADVKPVTDASLQAISGKEDLSQAVVARNTSNVSGNSVGDHSNTGTITFDQQSFQDLHGLSVVNANTGNNVSINASMNVNVAVRR